MIENMAPMLLDPGQCSWSPADLAAARLGGARRAHLLQQKFALDIGAEARSARLFDLAQGVAIIRMNGPLFDDDLILPASGMSGYGGLAAQHEAAQADMGVRAIFFDIHSPGGVVAPALEDLAADIRAGRGNKPILANVRGVAASAAYWIASGATAISIPDLGLAGSIGVWTLHIDISEMLKEFGVTPTLIHSGEHKVDGHPFKPLPASVKADFQADIDDLRLRFATAVAGPRKLDVKAVMATEARIYKGREAVEAGLADQVMSRKAALQSLIDSVA